MNDDNDDGFDDDDDDDTYTSLSMMVLEQLFMNCARFKNRKQKKIKNLMKKMKICYITDKSDEYSSINMYAIAFFNAFMMRDLGIFYDFYYFYIIFWILFLVNLTTICILRRRDFFVSSSLSAKFMETFCFCFSFVWIYFFVYFFIYSHKNSRKNYSNFILFFRFDL